MAPDSTPPPTASGSTSTSTPTSRSTPGTAGTADVSRIAPFHRRRPNSGALEPRLHHVLIGDLRHDGPLPAGVEDPSGHRLAGLGRDWLLTAPVGSVGPVGPPDEMVAQVLLEVDRRIVGSISMLPGTIMIDDEPVPISWLSGFAVDPDQRRHGHGRRILQAVLDLGIATGAIGSSAMSTSAFDDLGWHRVRCPRTAFIRRTGRLIPAHLPGPLGRPPLAGPLARLLAPPADLAAGLERSIRGLARGLPRGWWTEEVGGPRAIDTEAFPGRGTGSRVRCPRTAPWLRWMLDHATGPAERRPHPHVVRDAGGRIVGSFILKTSRHARFGRFAYRDLELTTVKDWQAADGRPATARRIARLAVLEALRRPVDAVHLATSDIPFTRELRRLGGHRAGGLGCHLHLPASSPARHHVALAAGDVDLRAADGDHFTY